jgi:hypothetical protein
MGRGYRDMRMINPAEGARPGRLRPARPRPFRVWVSGVLCVTPNADGTPGVAVEMDGVRSGIWADTATLPLAPLLPFDDLEPAWRPATASPDLRAVAASVVEAITAAAAEIAARRWNGSPT